jgi:ferredoxin
MKMGLKHTYNRVEIKEAPSRFRNPIGKYKIRRSQECINCGKCVELCPYGVHVKHKGLKRVSRPKDHKCIGFACQQNDFCVSNCPQNALSLGINQVYKTLGDYRWTSDLILSTWTQAETGDIPHAELEYRTGNSGGGFDKLFFNFPEEMEDFTTLDDQQMPSVDDYLIDPEYPV